MWLRLTPCSAKDGSRRRARTCGCCVTVMMWKSHAIRGCFSMRWRSVSRRPWCWIVWRARGEARMLWCSRSVPQRSLMQGKLSKPRPCCVTCCCRRCQGWIARCMMRQRCCWRRRCGGRSCPRLARCCWALSILSRPARWLFRPPRFGVMPSACSNAWRWRTSRTTHCLCLPSPGRWTIRCLSVKAMPSGSWRRSCTGWRVMWKRRASWRRCSSSIRSTRAPVMRSDWPCNCTGSRRRTGVC